MKLPEYNILEARQVTILKQIHEHKQHVECLDLAVRLSDVNNPAEILDKNYNVAYEVWIIIDFYGCICFWSTCPYFLYLFFLVDTNSP